MKKHKNQVVVAWRIHCVTEVLYELNIQYIINYNRTLGGEWVILLKQILDYNTELYLKQALQHDEIRLSSSSQIEKLD